VRVSGEQHGRTQSQLALAYHLS